MQNFIRQAWFKYVVLFGAPLMLMQPPVATAQQVTLTWNLSGNTNVAGYKIYVGTMSGQYTNVTVVGNTNSVTLTWLAAGTTYYSAATAYDATGDESAYSNEAIFVTTPTAAVLASAVNSGGQFSFRITGIPGSAYAVEASSNLVNWVSVQTNLAPFTFVDQHMAEHRQQFYRAVAL